ncbi:hypothetical protein BDV96DRAFT_461599, partial [Lophiotrema nucula]
LLHETTRWIPRAPLGHQSTRRALLEKPVAIPRAAVKGLISAPLPFLRAYSHVLEMQDVHMPEFLAFIENLNIVQTAPAPLQALGLVGTGIGFVPWHWAFAAGAALEITAAAASKSITVSRTKTFLETVNSEYFGPRNLKVSLRKDEELAGITGYPESWPALVPVDEHMTIVSVRDRRMQALAPYIAPLSLDVPPPAPPQNMLDKISAKTVARKLQNQNKKDLKEQKKLREDEGDEEDPEKRERKNLKKVKKLEYIVIENLH